MRKRTTAEFIALCIQRNKNYIKYDYSSTIYTDCKSKINVICPDHGLFVVTADVHFKGSSCPECSKQKRNKTRTKTTENFIERARLKHNDFYDYSKTIYVKAKDYVTITCPKHGDFKQLACNHLLGLDCMLCGNEKISMKKSLKNFFEIAKEIHEDKYDYSKSIFVNTTTNIIITCKKHGDFEQSPSSHLYQKAGCPKCANEMTAIRCRKTIEQFIIDAKSIHGEKYDYSKSVYPSNFSQNIEIICNIHGSFNQRVGNHLNGAGCPKCATRISKQENEWLTYVGVPNDKEYRQVYIKLSDGGYIIADGFYNNTVYEFWGDVWHGNPNIYTCGKHPITGVDFSVLYSKTLEKIDRIKKSGYDLIEIWESDWQKIASHLKQRT